MPDEITIGSVFFALKWIVIGAVVLWFARTIILGVLRFFGLFNPDHYWLLPRVPWRTALKPVVRFQKWFAYFSMGKKQTAKWAGPIATLCMMYRPGMVFLGRVNILNIPWFMPVGIKTKRHLVAVAGTGAGKSTTLVAMLALHRGNAFVIDPKGQLTRILRRRMGAGGDGIIGKGKRAFVLDPLGMIDGCTSAHWNPFHEMATIEKTSGRSYLPEIADKMAHAIVTQDSDSQPFFSNASREFVKGLILHIYTTIPTGQQNLVYLRRKLTCGNEEITPGTEHMTGIERLIMEMCQNDAFEAIANAAALVRDALKRDNFGTYLSSAIVQLGWIDYESIAGISGRSDFSLDELKNGDVSVFVCAKTTDVQKTYTGWFRLLAVMAAETFERVPGRPKYPTMFAIDEMPSLGRIEAFELAAPVLRSYGVQLLAITQDLGLLGETYPKTWASFLGNADAVLWMASNHNKSLEYLENELGSFTDEAGRDRPIAYVKQLKDYMEAERSRVVITLTGKRALRLSTPHYFKELPVTHYDRDPDEKEKPQRALTRAVASKIIGPGQSSELANRSVTPSGSASFNDARGVIALEYLSDGSRFVTSELDEGKKPRLGVYDAKTLGLLSFVPLSGEPDQPYTFGVVPGEAHVWICNRTWLRCIDLDTGQDVTKPIKSRGERAASIHVLDNGSVLTHGGGLTAPGVATRLSIWDPASRKRIQTVATPFAEGTVEGVGSDQAGLIDETRNQFFTGQHTGYVRQWDTRTLELIRDVQVKTPDGHGEDYTGTDDVSHRANMIHALALSEDRNRLAVGTQAGVIHVVELDQESDSFALIPSDFESGSMDHPAVTALLFLNDTTLLAGYEDGGLRTWNINARKQVGAPVACPYSDDGVAPKPRRLVALCGNNRVVAFDPAWHGATPLSPWIHEAGVVAAESYKF